MTRLVKGFMMLITASLFPSISLHAEDNNVYYQ